MGISILGFNLGIELMQLAVVAVIVPWLFMLSRTSFYTGIRITGAVLSAIAALAWITERASDRVNPVSGLLQRGAPYAPWLIVILAVLTGIVFWLERNKQVYRLKKDKGGNKIPRAFFHTIKKISAW